MLAAVLALFAAHAPAARAAGENVQSLRHAELAIAPAGAPGKGTITREVTLPHAWEVTDPGVVGDAWYRLRWPLDAVPDAPQAIYLSAITVPAQVLVNGALVSASDLDGPSPRSYERGPFAMVPPELLHAGTNDVVVHLRARTADVAGLGPVLAGRARSVREHQIADLTARTFGPAAVSVATFTVGLFIFILWLRRRDADYLLFGTGAMLWSVHTLATLLPQPLLPQPHWTIAWHTLYMAFVCLLCLFCMRFAGFDWPGYRRTAIGYACATLPVLYLAHAGGVGDEASALLRLGAIGLVLVALAAVGRYAVRQRNLESNLLLAAGAVSALFAMHDWIANQDPLDLRPVWLVPYAALAFLTLVGYILTDRFLRALDAAEQLNVELERRVDEKSRALRHQLAVSQQARDDAETANRAKSSFLAAASHDLRQPLHALGMFSQALAVHVQDADARMLVHRINTSVAALETLFSALLDVSKLDAGVVVAQRCSLHVRPLLARLADELMPEASERGLRLAVVSPDAVVLSDPMLLERIVRNLVSNALRYTATGGVLVACRRRGTQWSLEVWDTGSGIAAGERERIFEEFYQGSRPATQRAGGLGLGLAIVRRLAELLGHEVSVDSRVGRGSVFRVRVPAGEPEDAQARHARQQAGPIAGRHVLVIDDDEDVRDAALRLLAQWGCRVTVVPDGEAACRQCEAGLRPDALLVDYRLGAGMDGLATIAAVRAVLGTQVPAALISGESEAAQLARITASGVALLHKPLPAARLRSVLAHLLASAVRDEAFAR
jgi:signal transduction histidine kinase/ActR/RegA family two-component response regulator